MERFKTKSPILRNYPIWITGALFVLFVGFSVALEFYVFAAIPFALLFVAWSFYHLNSLLLFVVAITPLSISLKDSTFNLGVSLPTEPILAGITFFLLLRFLQNGKLPWSLLKHPVSVALLMQLSWMGFSILTSEMPMVSFKSWISNIWFVVPLFFAMFNVFESKTARSRFFLLYAISLAISCLYTLYVHSQYGFSKQTSTWVMFPFYKEHTAYGMALAFIFPFAIYQVLKNQKFISYVLSAGLIMLLTIATVFSYSRASWLSIVAALGVYVLIRFKINLKYFFFGSFIVLSSLYVSQEHWMRVFTKNDTVSSDNFSEHIKSISNISTDASNLERINRWMSAIRMFKERPLTGWGPGTYQFQYAPFQHSSEMTVISTNSGNRGNAHSEYIGLMAEQGLPGLILMLVFLITLFSTGFRVVNALKVGSDRSIAICALLGLVSYFCHGVLNNFLDMDKAAVLVWGSASLLVFLDLKFKKEFYSSKKVKKSILE